MELDNILKEDQRIKNHLQRREDINSVVSNNKMIISKSKENIDTYLMTSQRNLRNYLNLDKSELTMQDKQNYSVS